MNAGCAGKTVRSLENACHTWAPKRCVHDEALYKSTFTFTFTFSWQFLWTFPFYNCIYDSWVSQRVGCLLHLGDKWYLWVDELVMNFCCRLLDGLRSSWNRHCTSCSLNNSVLLMLALRKTNRYLIPHVFRAGIHPALSPLSQAQCTTLIWPLA